MHKGLMLLMALLLPGPALAAGLTCASPAEPGSPPPVDGQLQELSEVVVRGSKITSRTKDLASWLKLLEGQYRYEGHVDLCGNGNAADLRPVTGSADCVGLYNSIDDELPRSLYCAIDVRWPKLQGENGDPAMERESTLSPAIVVWGMAPDLPGIQFIQIDNQGMTSHAQGRLVGDTLTTMESCGMNGTCRRVTRITAQPGSSDITMQVDDVIESTPVLRQDFVLHRVSNFQLSRNRFGDAALNRLHDQLQSMGNR